MPSLKSYEIERLEKALSGVLGGLRLQEWADLKTEELLSSATTTGGSVQFTADVLATRRIVAVRPIETEPHRTDWGRLLTDPGGFVVELPSALDKQPLWRRFALAHEIAHTFFYNLSEWPPQRRTFLTPGSRDLEWLCDALAARFLVPSPRLRAEIARHPLPEDPNFSLACLKKLERLFEAPWQIVARRVVDERVWRGLLLHLRAYTPPPRVRATRRKWALNWYLEWCCASADVLDDLAIATAFRSHRGHTRHPRVWGDLVALLTKWTDSGTRQGHRTELVPIEALRIGKLPTLLRDAHGSERIRVTSAIKAWGVPRRDVRAPARRTPKASIVLYVPLAAPRE